MSLVETHGRQETAALLDGLEVLPRKEIPYRDRVLREFDLDGALARRPALILVDELAHKGALLLKNPSAIENPFYLLAPGWALIPMVLLTTAATVIASQAVISGAFSVARQAVRPRPNFLSGVRVLWLHGAAEPPRGAGGM